MTTVHTTARETLARAYISLAVPVCLLTDIVVAASEGGLLPSVVESRPAGTPESGSVTASSDPAGPSAAPSSNDPDEAARQSRAHDGQHHERTGEEAPA